VPSQKEYNMLRSIIISPDRVLATELQHGISQTGRLAVARVLSDYPSESELSRVVRAYAPQVVFMSTDSIGRVVAVATQLEQVLPGVQIVAAGRDSDSTTLMTLMRAGIREFASSPLQPGTLDACISRAEDNLRRRPVAVSDSTELVYSFCRQSLDVELQLSLRTHLSPHQISSPDPRCCATSISIAASSASY
jgi:DNA-binding NarL/FixJ family response regulator